MVEPTFGERATGALMGAFVGEALGVGPHWYYDLGEMRRDHGEWIDGYVEPVEGRYHEGLEAGQLSQAGFILDLTVRSLVACGGYDEEDFCRRMDEELLPRLDGTPTGGPGGYTSQSIRDLWRQRVEEGLSWEETGGHADTTEAIERTLAIACRYARDLERLARDVTRNAMLTQTDHVVVSMTVAYGSVLAMLLRGHALDGDLSGKLMERVKSGELPFHAVTTGDLEPPRAGEPDPPRAGRFASPDALLTPSCIARAVADPEVRVEPAWKVSLLYGMPCAIYHQLPAVYHLAARFPDDFESAVLHAIHGGGQNQARAMLTGALVGARVGVDGIPARFIEGLEEAEGLLERARSLASDARAG